MKTMKLKPFRPILNDKSEQISQKKRKKKNKSIFESLHDQKQE